MTTNDVERYLDDDRETVRLVRRLSTIVGTLSSLISAASAGRARPAELVAETRAQLAAWAARLDVDLVDDEGDPDDEVFNARRPKVTPGDALDYLDARERAAALVAGSVLWAGQRSSTSVTWDQLPESRRRWWAVQAQRAAEAHRTARYDSTQRLRCEYDPLLRLATLIRESGDLGDRERYGVELAELILQAVEGTTQ